MTDATSLNVSTGRGSNMIRMLRDRGDLVKPRGRCYPVAMTEPSTGFAWSDQINEIASALAAAQAEITSAEKSKENPHLKSKYASLADCFAACRTALAKAKLAVTQPVSRTDTGVLVVTILMHGPSGQWVRCELEMPAKHAAQDIGSAITYGRRYGLCALVGVAPDDDDDDDGEAADRGNRGSSEQRDSRAALEDARRAAFGRWAVLEKLLKARDGRAPDPGPWVAAKLGKAATTAEDYEALRLLINEEIDSIQSAP